MTYELCLRRGGGVKLYSLTAAWAELRIVSSREAYDRFMRRQIGGEVTFAKQATLLF